jgi:uncharacterized membrane protein YphA (DoxX/SURF4 family)
MTGARLRMFATTGLRLALGITFLVEVASRFGLLGRFGSNWTRFLKYAGEVNWYLPAPLIPAIGVLATFFETAFGLALVAGWQARKAALGSAGLLMLFALAMFSGDPRSPFDYSVFSASFGALTLACVWEDNKAERI